MHVGYHSWQCGGTMHVRCHSWQCGGTIILAN